MKAIAEETNDVEKWLRRLRKWIWWWRKREKPKPLRIIKRWYTRRGAILQVERNTPGARATLRIVKPGRQDYLLILDELCQLQADFIGEVNGTTITLRARPYPGILQNYRFAVFSINSSGASRLAGAWDLDLEGFNLKSSTVSRVAPTRALLQLAFSTLQSSDLDLFDWVGILEEKIRLELGNPNHRVNASELNSL
jgi:hypothetical protein